MKSTAPCSATAWGLDPSKIARPRRWRPSRPAPGFARTVGGRGPGNTSKALKRHGGPGFLTNLGILEDLLRSLYQQIQKWGDFLWMCGNSIWYVRLLNHPAQKDEQDIEKTSLFISSVQPSRFWSCMAPIPHVGLCPTPWVSYLIPVFCIILRYRYGSRPRFT